MKKQIIQKQQANHLVIYEDQKVDCIVSYCANMLNGDEMKEVSQRLGELSKNINNPKNKNHVINS